MKVETPCPVCAGSGVVRRPRQVKVRIPAGVADGQRIRLKGRGGAGHNGGPAGDLYVVVRVDTHPLFGRKGKHLTLTVPVTYPEAALGADGHGADPRPSPSPCGSRRAPARAAPSASRAAACPPPAGRATCSSPSRSPCPQRLTDAEREAVEALAAATTESPRRHLGV